MARYIDAEKIEYKTVAYPVFDFSTGMMHTKYLEGKYARQEYIDSLPKADVQEVKHGTWGKSLFAQDFFRCSLCSAVWNRKFEYCPHCGAKMDGGESK